MVEMMRDNGGCKGVLWVGIFELKLCCFSLFGLVLYSVDMVVLVVDWV